VSSAEAEGDAPLESPLAEAGWLPQKGISPAVAWCCAASRSGDAASLASACRRLLEDAGLVAALGREARSRFESELAPERQAQRLLALYAEVIARRAP